MVSREILEDAATYSRELESNKDERNTPNAENTLKKNKTAKKQVADKPAKRTNKTHVSPADPDARMSYKPGKVTKLNLPGTGKRRYSPSCYYPYPGIPCR